MSNKAAEIKNLNSALYGAIGSVLLFAISFVVVYSTPGDDPPAGLVVVNGLAVFSALIFWFSGLVGIVKLLLSKSSYRTGRKAIASYILICIPLIFFLARTILAG